MQEKRYRHNFALYMLSSSSEDEGREDGASAGHARGGRMRPDLHLPYRFDPDSEEEEEIEEQVLSDLETELAQSNGEEEEEEEGDMHREGVQGDDTGSWAVRRAKPHAGEREEKPLSRPQTAERPPGAEAVPQQQAQQAPPPPREEKVKKTSLLQQAGTGAAGTVSGRKRGEDGPKEDEEKLQLRRERAAAGSEARKDADEQRAQQRKRAEFVSTLRRLEEKRVQAENEVAAAVFGRQQRGGAPGGEGSAGATGDVAQLEEQSVRMAGEVAQERARLTQHVAKIRNAVEQFKWSLQHMAATTPQYVEKIKKTMDTIEAAVASYKNEQRDVYQRLADEEKLLDKELDGFAKKIEAWESGTAAAAERPGARARKVGDGTEPALAQGELLPEVQKFEEFEARNGGRNGGWEEYDHGTFLRLRKKARGDIDALASAVASALAGQDEAAVRAHEMWFREHGRLLEKKKKAIEAWRVAREAERQQVLEQVEEEKRVQQEEEKRRAEKHAEELRKERDAQAQQIKEWKEAKRLEEEAVLRQQQEEALRAARGRERVRREHEEEIRDKAAEYLAKKKEEQRRRDAMEAARQAAERDVRKVKEEDLAWFRERDQQAQAERLAKKQQEEDEEKQRQARLDKIKQKVGLCVCVCVCVCVCCVVCVCVCVG